MATVTTDPSILLQNKPNIPLLTAEHKMLMMTQADKLKQEQGLRNVLSDPSLWQNGQLTPQGYQKALTNNPEEARAIMATQSLEQQRQQQAQESKFKLDQEKTQALSDAASPVVEKFDNLIASGVPEKEAYNIIQSDWKSAFNQLKAGGFNLSDQHGAANKQLMDALRSHLTSKTRKESENREYARNKDTRAEESLKQRQSYEEKMVKLAEERLKNSEKANELKNFVDEESVDSRAHAIQELRLKPLTAREAATPYGRAVMKKLLEIDPAYTDQTYATRAQSLKFFSPAGKGGFTLAALNTGIDHLKTLDGLINAMNTGDSTTINKIANAIKGEFDLSTAPTDFEAAKTIISNEVVKSILGNGAGALKDREEAQAAINGSKSPAQLKSAVATIKKLMAGQLRTQQRQYENSTGKKDFLEPDKLLSKEAIEQLTSLHDEENTNKPKDKAEESTINKLDDAQKAKMLERARNALKNGAPRDAVINLMKSQGLNPGDL